MAERPTFDSINRRDVVKGAAGVGAFALAGCTGDGGENGDGGSDEDGTENGDGGGGGSEVVRWHAGGTGGTYFPLSGEFETTVENETEYDMEVSATGASVENVGSLGAGDADFALIQNDIAFFAKNGTGIEAFEGNAVESLQGVATLYPETIHIITRPGAGIESVSDMEGMRVNTGDLGSGTQVNALQILESAGGLTQDDFDEQNTDFTQAANQIQDGDIDAAFVVGGWPVGAVEELAQTADMGLLSMPDDERQAARDDASWFADDTIPGGTYEGVDEDIETVSVQAMIATREGYDAEIVENVTAAIFDNVGDLSIKTDFIGSDSAQDGMPIEIHAGAEAYFG